ncbi:hypothetical protein RHMOL_Rhmol03G0132600 [Rhododendron molle]|uniref:Uncharacterized protein n=1 Tax=Rhododendron molle TaxID=49168 RepID=A0ACC0PG39_RHOML|nr:hypothetical protein RHMOL_Rhmol03G0132600 [Rhododendron molle]
MDIVSPLPSQTLQSSVNSSKKSYIPQVKNDLIPKIKQEFVSLDAIYEFYNNYGKESGFGTREWSSRKNGDKVVVRKEYVCCKQGHWVSKKLVQIAGTSKRRRGIIREGCGAKLAVVRSKSGDKYVVTKFVEAHNHSLASPGRTHLLPSHRKVTSAKRALAEQLSQANVPTCQQMSIFEVQAGGLKNVGFGLQDLYNSQRDIRTMLLGQDADMLYEYFQIQQQKNPGFMFSMEKDDEMRLKHCFWADARARKSYQYFGDVVVFDTTYNTNRYRMIFAPILGVNHHRQTTLFGCGLLSDESSESFEWLFKEWLKAMPGGPPKMIITDQDPAMTKAFANVLPNTHHRYCIWHIRYVSLNNSLYDFVTRFARGLAHIRHNELDLDHKDLNEKPQLMTPFPMESTMSELYTLAIFHKFQDEIFQILGYMVKMTHEDEHYRFYTVQRAKVSGARVRNLMVNKSSDHVSCSCKLFEFDGIPCRHLLAYFNRMEILDLPDEFILARWTKSAKIKTVVNDVGGSVEQICDTSMFQRRNKLFKLASSVIDDAVLTEDGSEILEEALCSVRNELCAMNLGSGGGKLSGSVSHVAIPCEHNFKDASS